MDYYEQQLTALAQRFEKEPGMIDPVEFGEMKGAVASLQMQFSDMRGKQASMDHKIDLVLSQLSEAKGGWKVMLMFGGAATTLGAGLTWLVNTLSRH